MKFVRFSSVKYSFDTPEDDIKHGKEPVEVYTTDKTSPVPVTFR